MSEILELPRDVVIADPVRPGYVMYRRSWPPTEKTLNWCRENIPHFATCEKQARAARAPREGQA